jgi:HK97 family phage major capsid protein
MPERAKENEMKKQNDNGTAFAPRIMLGAAVASLMNRPLFEAPDDGNGAPAGTTGAPASGKQAEVDLDALVTSAVTKAVGAALDAAGVTRAPAVHGVKEPSKEYVDDAIRDTLGADAAAQRRESEAVGRHRGLSGSRSVVRAPLSRHGERSVGSDAAEFVAWMCAAGGDIERAHRMAKKGNGTPDVVKALGESSFTNGGAFVPENIASDYIELLRNTSVYLAAGPVKITVQNGNLTLPKQTGGATPAWLGESQNITVGAQTVGSLRIVLKDLAVLTAASNQFLRDSGPSAIDMIKNDLAAAAATEIDSTALRSLGTEYKPKGLRGWVPSGHQLAASGTDVASITSDLFEMFQKLEEAKIMAQRLAMFMSPRTKYGIMSKRDSNNNLIWADEMRGGTLMGAALGVTQNIPNDVGTGGNKSEIYLVDMSQQLFAEEPGGMMIDVRDGVAYHDGSAVVSAYSRNESAVRLTQRVDIVERQSGNGIVQTYDVAYAA